MQFRLSPLSRDSLVLRRRLTYIARRLRHTTLPEKISYSHPQSTKNDFIRFKNSTISRKRIVLLTGSCSIASCTMCHLPNEALWTDRPQPTTTDLLNQFHNAFENESISDYDMITIYNNGNFFSDREVPPVVRNQIAKEVSQAGCKYLLVESLPQFITTSTLHEISQILGNTKLVLSIGLQSANDYVREVAINSTCSIKQFERVVKEAKALNHEVMTFVMLKAPFLTESEGIEDVLETLSYLTKLGITEIALCPTQISENTIVDLLFKEQSFKPPSLWSIIEVLELASQRKLNLPRIATSVLSSESYQPARFAKSCYNCSGNFIKLLEHYNDTRSLIQLREFYCDCSQKYREDLSHSETRNLNNRIEEFVNKHFSNIL